MGTKNKVKNLQTSMGNLHEVIPPLVESLGQKGAGKKLGVSESTINQWLKEHGYKRVTRYIRIESAT